MAGIYIHIPFCKTRCSYCDFYTGTDETQMDAFVGALCTEARIRKDEIHESVQSIYFGGGTPSRLRSGHLEKIFDALQQHFTIESTAEITVEANPDDLTEAYLDRLSRLPVNRLSIGIQSFNDEELTFLSRRHTAREAIDAVKRCRGHGFENISIDLMYGLPNQTEAIWHYNLTQAIALNLPHISSYHLIYEEKTKMYSLLQAGKIKPVDEEVSTTLFAILIDRLTSQGYLHYEISAFGKEGYFSRHNSAYWTGEKYLGLGPAAHSFDGDSRSLNIPSLTRYIKGIESGKLYREIEQLGLSEKYNEAVLTGLRTMWGLDLTTLTTRVGEEFHRYCLQNAQKYLERKMLKVEGDRLKLTRDGIFISDGIMSDLMWVG